MKKYAAGDMVDDEVDLEETGGFGRAAVAEAAKRPTYAQQKTNELAKKVTTPAPKSKLKGRIVTKEELAKSGLSLRDFLNKERGLTRRKDKAPTKEAPKFDKSKAAEVPKPTMDLSKKPSTPAKRPMKISEIGRRKMSMEDKMKAVRGMAKGGKVKKMDGCCVRGKTKCKMR